MEKKLGRGLEALIPQIEIEKEFITSVDIQNIVPNKFQPRKTFDIASLNELMASIQEKGIIQPIVVRPIENGQYELIAGERRLRAVQELGHKTVPCIVKQNVDDANSLELSLIENIQREELNALEEAQAYRELLDKFGYTQDQIAKQVGKNKSTISNSLRLLSLPDDIKNYLLGNSITMGHARALLSIPSETAQCKVCKTIMKKNLSVRQTELLISKKYFSKPRNIVLHKDEHVKQLEEELRGIFGTRIRVLHGKKRGKIIIEYYSLDDLDRVLSIVRKH